MAELFDYSDSDKKEKKKEKKKYVPTDDQYKTKPKEKTEE